MGTTRSTTRTRSNSNSKGGIMKKIIHYMQEQAVHQSPSTAYLAPPGKEPQQRGQYNPPSSHRHQHQHTSSANAGSRTSSPNPPIAYPLPSDIINHQYASDNILQSYTVWIPPSTSASRSSQKFFVIYLHGGYYRDPKVQASSFKPTLSLLAHQHLHPHHYTHGNTNTTSHISGYASINYRLSPHPAHPQDPTKTSNYERRNASHPQHVEDVLTAIRDLQRRYRFGSNYILIGHSVGATLALQVALCQTVPWVPPHSLSGAEEEERELARLRRESTVSTTSTLVSPRITVIAPKSVVGVNGIYDFNAIHETQGEYERMTRNACFPPDSEPSEEERKRMYDAVSPARYERDMLADEVRSVVLASSRSDTLVPWGQVERMAEVLREGEGSGVGCKVMEISGDHDDVWRKGEDLVRLIGVAVRELVGGAGRSGS